MIRKLYGQLYHLGGGGGGGGGGGFENPRRGRQVRNFTTNVPKILQYSSEILKHLCDFPLPNVYLGFAVISVLQNTRGSTLGKERGCI